METIDRYLGDAVLRITLMEYKTLDTINGQNNVPVFFVINYQDEGQEFATKRVSATKNVLYTLNWIYDVDIPETATYVNVEFEAVAENTGWLGDDAQLDIDQDDSNKFNAYWTISSTPFIGTGTDSGGSYDAYLKVKMERAVAEKARVIVINGTGEDGDYGLDTVSTGIYRYSADDQVYLVVLNVSGTSAHFQSGMNTIILPRAIALQCQLNDTLYDLQNVGSSPLNGASFYSTDPLKVAASGHIIAVISKNVTASQAETILTMLTHNSTGVRVGNNVTISTTSLYLLHLPNDILSAIPTSVMNSGMGEGPNYYSIGSIIGDIAGMVFDFLVWVATGGVLLLLAHLVKEGLKAISDLISTAITAVEAAVDRIVNAFCAMVDWTIDLIQATINTLLDPIIDGINDLINEFIISLVNAWNNSAEEYEHGGNVSPNTISLFYSAIFGNLFWLLFGINSVIKVIFSTISVVTNVAGFLLSMAISLTVQAILGGFSDNNEITSYDINGAIAPSGYLDINMMEEDVESEVQNTNIDWVWIWGLFAIIVAQFFYKISYASWVDSGCSEWGEFGNTLGLLSFIIAASSQFSYSPFINAILALTSFGLGAISFGMSLMELAYSGIIASSALNLIVGIIAILISSYATGLSIQNLNEV